MHNIAGFFVKWDTFCIKMSRLVLAAGPDMCYT